MVEENKMTEKNGRHASGGLKVNRRQALYLAGSAAAVAAMGAGTMGARAQTPGVSETEIRIGQTAPYSGGASNMSTMSKAEAAYFEKVNAEGGIAGRKIRLISLDDGYSPAKTVEQTRRLVEQEDVACIFHPIGTGPALAVAKYLNQREIPHLLIGTGSTKFHEPENLPWSLGYDASSALEGKVFGKFLLDTRPESKIAILHQNDDFGEAYLHGLHEALGDKKDMIVGIATYEVTDSTVDSQISNLRASGADVFINASIPKFAAQAIRKVHDIGWKPYQLLTMKSNFFSVTLEPAGLDKTVGLVSMRYRMDPADSAWDNDPGMIEWREFMKKYNPSADQRDGQNIDGYITARIMEDILRRCDGDFSRPNIMDKATSIKDLAVPTLVPGILINTSKTDYDPISQVQMISFDGAKWSAIGDIISA